MPTLNAQPQILNFKHKISTVQPAAVGQVITYIMLRSMSGTLYYSILTQAPRTVEHTNNKCVQEEKQANSYAHIFLEPNNRVMLLGACVKPQPLNYLLCTTKLRVSTTPPSSERAGNNVAGASKATEAHQSTMSKEECEALG